MAGPATAPACAPRSPKPTSKRHSLNFRPKSLNLRDLLDSEQDDADSTRMGPQYQIAKCVICCKPLVKMQPKYDLFKRRKRADEAWLLFVPGKACCLVCLCVSQRQNFSSMDGKLDSGRQAHEGQYFCCNRKRTNGKLSKHSRLPIPFCISLVS